MTEFVIAEDAAYALVQNAPGASTTYANLVWFDPASMTVLGNAMLRNEPAPQPPLPNPERYQLQFAVDGGGVFYDDGPFSNQIAPGEWAEWRGGPALVAYAEVPRASTAWAFPQGSPYQRNAPLLEFTITINTFIPAEWLDNYVRFYPFGHPTYDFESIFEGDNRRHFDINGSSRTKQITKVDFFGIVGQSQTRNGWTKLYHKTSSLDAQQHLTAEARNDTVLNDKHLKVAERLSPDTGTATAVRSGGKVEVTFTLSSNNPLADFELFNAIDYTIVLTIDFVARKYQVRGTHDAFPNYEMYINTQRVHHFDHGDNGPVFGLDAGTEITFDHPWRDLQ